MSRSLRHQYMENNIYLKLGFFTKKYCWILFASIAIQIIIRLLVFNIQLISNELPYFSCFGCILHCVRLSWKPEFSKDQLTRNSYHQISLHVFRSFIVKSFYHPHNNFPCHLLTNTSLCVYKVENGVFTKREKDLTPAAEHQR